MNFSDPAEREWILLYGVSISFTDENDVPGWGPPGDDVDGVADDGGAEAVAGGGHGRLALPFVLGWIVGFDVGVDATARFAAEDENFYIRMG